MDKLDLIQELLGDFPGGPVVKTPCFHCRGAGDVGSFPGWGTKIPHAAAKSLQLCPTLCNPTDSSPPGSPVPGILQARTLEWVAISHAMRHSQKKKNDLLEVVIWGDYFLQDVIFNWF